MPIKLKCDTCGQFRESTRIRLVRCASADVCGCSFPSERKEALCDPCAKGRKESS
jgi:hypothetical protein